MGYAIALGQLDPHERFDGVALPIGQPCEDQQSWTLYGAVLAGYAECPAILFGSVHRPSAAGAQIRLRVSRPEPSGDAPPLYALGRIRERLEHAFGGRFDRDLFDDRIYLCRGKIHRFSSTYRLRFRIESLQKAL